VTANGTGQDPELMTPAEVAALFRVDPKTVTKWARKGKLSPIRTLGGHRRYKTAEIRALLATAQIPKQPADGPDLDDVLSVIPHEHRTSLPADMGYRQRTSRNPERRFTVTRRCSS
jgi:excisionase family DNA binding protein